MIKNVLLTFIFLNCLGCANLADRWLNDVTLAPPYKATAEAEALHKTLTIVDMHADPLLWNRDLLERNSRGHVDLPRLQEGHVAVQVFGVVTGVPFPLSLEDNEDSADVITLLALLQGWPDETHDSRLQRALYQANKLKNSIAVSNDRIRLIKNRHDLRVLMAVRAAGTPQIGAMLSLEGAHALEGNPDNIEVLFDAGFRMLGLVHLFDNDMAGSTHGTKQHGLTDKGRILLNRALELDMIIDVAHVSPQTLEDVLAVVERPIVASHGGVRATCDTARNLSDEQIRGIAATGGVIGIGLYKYATCGKSMEDSVRAIRHVVDLVGIEHVALGSDFDGATETVVDATGLVLLTEGLQRAGFSEEEIRAIMGENTLRVFYEVLPKN